MKPTDIFHPVELQLLAKYFDLEPPEGTRDFDLELDQGTAFIDLAEGPDYDAVFNPLSNAVARIVINPVQQKLPQCRISKEGEPITLTRKYEDEIDRPQYKGPKLLFTINWGTSGPGISWPEAYHVGYLPVFNRYVVVASADSSECYGWTDFALGHFGPDSPLLFGCMRLIIDYWSETHGHREEAYEFVIEEGQLTDMDAETIAGLVWSQPPRQAPRGSADQPDGEETNYFNYKLRDFSCEKCSWKGRGSQFDTSGSTEEVIELHCPFCHEFHMVLAIPMISEAQANRHRLPALDLEMLGLLTEDKEGAQ